MSSIPLKLSLCVVAFCVLARCGLPTFHNANSDSILAYVNITVTLFTVRETSAFVENFSFLHAMLSFSSLTLSQLTLFATFHLQQVRVAVCALLSGFARLDALAGLPHNRFLLIRWLHRVSAHPRVTNDADKAEIFQTNVNAAEIFLCKCAD